MPGRKSKQKGKYFEEQVAKYFRQVLNETRENIHRAFTSGISNIEKGDIVFTNYKIVVECKNHSTFSYYDIFPKLSKQLFNYYKSIEKYRDHLKILAINNSSNRKFKPLAVLDKLEVDRFIKEGVLKDSLYLSPYIITHYCSRWFFVQDLKVFITFINFEKLHK